MKKMLLLIIVSLVFMSCDLSIHDELCDYKFNIAITKSTLYYADYSSVKEYSDITSYLIEHIEPRETHRFYWPTAKETLINGYSDCKGMAIVYLNILYIQFDIKGELVAIDARTIEEGGPVNHARVRLPSGEIIEPYTGQYSTDPVGYSYSFDKFFYTL